MSHECHAHGCTKQIPPRMLMCMRHWSMLRSPMQKAIWREYRSGQEIDKSPSARYLCVQRRSVGEVAFRPNDEQAARDAAPYLLKAERLRQACIRQGHGDPLKGLVPALVERGDPAGCGGVGGGT